MAPWLYGRRRRGAAPVRPGSGSGVVPLGLWEVEGVQDGLLAGGGRRSLGDLAVGRDEGDQVHPVELTGVPSVAQVRAVPSSGSPRIPDFYHRVGVRAQSCGLQVCGRNRRRPVDLRANSGS